MKKINLIFIIILIALFSTALGFWLGAYISNPIQPNNNFLANCEENTLTKIEARLKQNPALFTISIENNNQTKISGTVKNLYPNQILLTRDQSSLHDLIWDIDKDVRFNITENTKIYFKQAIDQTEITNTEQTLPDGTIINLPGQRFKNVDISFDELKKGDQLIVSINPEDFEENIIDALEIILIK